MPEFVEVIVEATGRRETVPSDWLDSPVLSEGISLAPAVESKPSPAPVLEPPSEVQTVLGESDDLPIIPVYREAALEARAEAVAALAEGPPTEDDLAATIEAFAADHGIDLGAAKTKAEKVEVINTHLADVTASSDEIPATGDKE